MKKVLIAVAAIAALPATAQAQDVQAPGVYFGVEGGLNWMFNTTILGQNVSPLMGWAAGGKIGYDFIGPRVEVEGLYRENQELERTNAALSARLTRLERTVSGLVGPRRLRLPRGDQTVGKSRLSPASPAP